MIRRQWGRDEALEGHGMKEEVVIRCVGGEMMEGSGKGPMNREGMEC